jgi:hypothetical protein
MHAGRPWALAATAATVATIVVYRLLISQQSTGDSARVAVVTILLLGFAGLAALGAIAPRRRLRVGALTASAIGLFVFGFLALFSIGLLLMLAALLAAIAVVRNASTTQAQG